MNCPSNMLRIVPRYWLGNLAIWLAFFLVGLSPRPCEADEAKPAKEERRVSVAKLTAPSGTIHRREAADKGWHPVMEGEGLFSRDLLLGLRGPVIESKNGAVRIALLGDLDELSPLPIVESAVILHENKQVDLDFTLDCGRVDLSNNRKKGPARVQVRFHNEVWDLTLAEPGTHVTLEISGRWPPGAPFSKEVKPSNAPAATVILLVLKGQVDAKCSAGEHTLNAPPGPALFQWDSVSGSDTKPQRLDKLPVWAAQETAITERGKRIDAILENLRRQLLEKPVGPTLTEMVKSEDRDVRAVAVLGMGAFDELPRLGDSLVERKYPDVWENSVIALRHWIGRGPGQDLKVYNNLLTLRKYSPGQAAIVMQLLHSFGDNDLAQPETYETLIEYLKHERLAIRGLAAWHLYRLAPAGKDILYNPNGTKDEQERAYNEWKKLVPSGQMPPRAKTDK